MRFREFDEDKPKQYKHTRVYESSDDEM